MALTQYAQNIAPQDGLVAVDLEVTSLAGQRTALLLDDGPTALLDELEPDAAHRRVRLRHDCVVSALQWILDGSASRSHGKGLANFLRKGNHTWRTVMTRNFRAVEKMTEKARASSLLSSVRLLKWYPKPEQRGSERKYTIG